LGFGLLLKYAEAVVAVCFGVGGFLGTMLAIRILHASSVFL